jgi:hypothetical protein
MSKSAFVRSLQEDRLALRPFDVSQRLRLQHGFVSVYQGDAELEIEDYRGYMVRYPAKHPPTPQNPELYVCVISLKQGKAMQNLVWTKEIIQVLDRSEHRTNNKDALGHMIDNRSVGAPHTPATPLNVKADKDGFTLALGCTVPYAYREILRREKYIERFTLEQLEEQLLVPAEYIKQLLDPSFEAEFEAKLLQCDTD